jgi:glycerophosphoryl diester phosphodiesterase
VWNNQVTRESIQDAHRRGLKVWVYTVNNVEKAQSLINLGVDGLISDHTPLIWKALALNAVK